MKRFLAVLLILVMMVSLLPLMVASASGGTSRTYTLDADFDEGVLLNVNHDDPNNDQLQLNEFTEPFPYIWIACSARGTVVRVDVNSGQILGEYRTAPVGRGTNPSRTTVDLYGNVWSGNRNEAAGGQGSIVKIGLVIGGTRCDAGGTPDLNGQYLKPPFDYSTAVDRDDDGLIKTSKGLGNILGWTDVTDGGGGAGGGAALVEDADDECILVYQRVHGNNTRHVSVDGNNNVWTAGNFGGDNTFDLLDGDTGAILATFDVGYGGYGGLVDGNGVLWSANRAPGAVTVLRYDTKNTITIADDTWSALNAPNAYGLGIDSNGHVWNAQWSSNQIREFDSLGSLLHVYPTFGASDDRGVAVTPIDDHIWVANSGGSDVSRLASNGALVKVIPCGSGPTGVAVDANGKVWAACLYSSTAHRIDPSGGGDGLGAVDLTVDLGAGAGPYNYSDMTGLGVLGTIGQGTWSVIHDSGTTGANYTEVNWNNEPEGAVPGDSSITVEVRASDTEAGLSGETFVTVADGADPGVIGRFIEIRATLKASSEGLSPVLSDLSVVYNQPPDCSGADADPGCLWPPNHKFVPITITGVTDPDGDPVTITIIGITSDEPTASDKGSGGAKHAPDASGVGTDTASVRAERSGKGDGRVYEISFTASDGIAECSGSVVVKVPHDQRDKTCPAIDSGQIYDAWDIN